MCNCAWIRLNRRLSQWSLIHSILFINNNQIEYWFDKLISLSITHNSNDSNDSILDGCVAMCLSVSLNIINTASQLKKKYSIDNSILFYSVLFFFCCIIRPHVWFEIWETQNAHKTQKKPIFTIMIMKKGKKSIENCEQKYA